MESVMGRNRRRAMAVVEMALVLPLLLVLTIALLEYGWMFVKYQQVMQAARQGARTWARADGDTTKAGTAVDFVMNQGNMPLGTAAYSITYTPGSGTPATGTPVTVKVSVPYGNVRLTNATQSFLPTPINLIGTVTMAREGTVP